MTVLALATSSSLSNESFHLVSQNSLASNELSLQITNLDHSTNGSLLGIRLLYAVMNGFTAF